jgi:hypothetical protein
VREQLERARCEPTKQSSQSNFDVSFARGESLAQATEALFRDWNVALAGEPDDRRRQRFSLDRLRKDFEREVACLQSARRFAPARENRILSDCDEEKGLLADLGGDTEYCELTTNAELLDRIARERQAGIWRIQSQVASVNQMFHDLASIVTNQGQKFESLEEHTKTAAAATRDATMDLRKTLEKQRPERAYIWYLLILFVILGFVFYATSSTLDLDQLLASH